jgi:hypothetical protein
MATRELTATAGSILSSTRTTPHLMREALRYGATVRDHVRDRPSVGVVLALQAIALIALITSSASVFMQIPLALLYLAGGTLAAAAFSRRPPDPAPEARTRLSLALAGLPRAAATRYAGFVELAGRSRRAAMRVEESRDSTGQRGG